MKLNINKEEQNLSTKAKKLWAVHKEMIEKVAIESKLSNEEKEVMIQTQMAALRIADLKEQNEYNRKSNDVFAKRAIKKNEAEIGRLTRIYNDNAKIMGEDKVRETYKKVTQLTANEIKRQNEQNKNKGRK